MHERLITFTKNEAALQQENNKVIGRSRAVRHGYAWVNVEFMCPNDKS